MFFHLFPTASRYNSLLGDAELRCLSAFKAGPAAIPFGTQLQVCKMLSLTRWTSLNVYNEWEEGQHREMCVCARTCNTHSVLNHVWLFVILWTVALLWSYFLDHYWTARKMETSSSKLSLPIDQALILWGSRKRKTVPPNSSLRSVSQVFISYPQVDLSQKCLLVVAIWCRVIQLCSPRNVSKIKIDI